MVTMGVFPFQGKTHMVEPGRIRDLVVSSQELWTPSHETGPNGLLELKTFDRKVEFFLFVLLSQTTMSPRFVVKCKKWKFEC